MELKEFLEVTKEGMKAGPVTREVLAFFIFPILHLLVFGVHIESICAAIVMTGMVFLLNLLNILVGVNMLTVELLRVVNEKEK